MEAIYVDIGARVKEWRLKRGMTQKQVGIAVGVSSNTISAIERATTRVSLHLLHAIVSVFDVKLNLAFTASSSCPYPSKPIVISGGLIT